MNSKTQIEFKKNIQNNTKFWDNNTLKETIQISSIKRNSTTPLQQATEIQTDTVINVVQTSNNSVAEILKINQQNYTALSEQYSVLHTNFTSLSMRIEQVINKHRVRVESLEQALTSTNNNLQDITNILAQSQEQTLNAIQSQLTTPMWVSITLLGGLVVLGGLWAFSRISALERIVSETIVNTPQVQRVTLPTAADDNLRVSIATFLGGLFLGISFLKFFKK